MNKLLKWWLSINWKTRSISITILVISIIMSNSAFAFLIYLQNELIQAHLRFLRDFSSLVSSDVIGFIISNYKEGLKDFLETIYLTTASLDYIRLFDSTGNIINSFPNNYLNDISIVDIDIYSLIAKSSTIFFNIPISVNSLNIEDSIINCIIPLLINDEIIGFLQLGWTFSSGVFYISHLAQHASSLIFVSVWFVFVLGAAFDFFIIIDPIRVLLIGMQSISLGKFDQHIDILVKGLLGDLIISFNAMAERLQVYEKKNILQLTSEKAKLESFISTIADGAILLDTESRIVFVNKIAIKAFQWFNKDLIGSIIFNHLPLHVNEALLPILNNMARSYLFDNSNMHYQELMINLNNDSLKTFRFLLSTILSHDRQYFNGIVLIIQDITRESQLNEAKNQFISNVSHELRTPLCNIGSFLETLIDYDYKLTLEQKTQFLDIAYAETQRLNSLVNDILDLSRLESECNYVLKPILLINTALYIVQASQLIALNQQVQVIIEVHPDVENIYAHQSSLCQVLSNLISNSLKFTHKLGRIVIRAYPLVIRQCRTSTDDLSPEVIRLEVIDEGIGIHKIFQRQVFDRFMRVENNIHALKGTGLGLSIVQNIVRKYNSSIYVYSEVDIGTSFWFDLFVFN